MFSVTILDIEPSDAGIYKCYDGGYLHERCHCLRDLHQTFIISVTAKCLCGRPEELADTVSVGGDKARVICSLQGYQSPHFGETAVNISLGYEMIQGNIIENDIIAYITAQRFCHDLSMKFYLDPDYSSMVQCQVPRLDSCPSDMSTTTFHGITLKMLQYQTLSARDEGTVLPPLSSTSISTIETRDHFSSLSKIILITSVATDVLIILLIILVVIILIVCFRKRRKRRSNPNNPHPTEESGTKTKGTDADCGTGVSPEVSMDTCMMKARGSRKLTNEEDGYLGLVFEEEGGRNMNSKRDDGEYMVPTFSDDDMKDDSYTDRLPDVSQTKGTGGNLGTEYKNVECCLPPDYESIM